MQRLFKRRRSSRSSSSSSSTAANDNGDELLQQDTPSAAIDRLLVILQMETPPSSSISLSNAAKSFRWSLDFLLNQPTTASSSVISHVISSSASVIDTSVITRAVDAWSLLRKIQQQEQEHDADHQSIADSSMAETVLISVLKSLCERGRRERIRSDRTARTAVSSVLGSSHCVEAILHHVDRALVSVGVPSNKKLHRKERKERKERDGRGDERGLLCLRLLAGAANIQRRRVRDLLGTRQMVPRLMAQMALLETNDGEEDREVDGEEDGKAEERPQKQPQQKPQQKQPLVSTSSTDGIGRAAISLLMSIDAIASGEGDLKTIVSSLTTVVLRSTNGTRNYTFAVNGLLQLATNSRRWRETTMEEDKDKEEVGIRRTAWSVCVEMLAPIYAVSPMSCDWYPVLLCRLGGRSDVQDVCTNISLRHLLRSIVLGVYPIFPTAAWAASSSVVSSSCRHRAACALSSLGDTLLPTSISWIHHRSRGVRILCMDGGGTRGLATLVSLRAIQRRCQNRPIHELFDVICGTSTGGILAVAIGMLRRPLDEVEDMYRRFAVRVFDQSTGLYKGLNAVTTGGMYDATPLENLLRDYGRDGGKHGMGTRAFVVVGGGPPSRYVTH